MAKRKIIRKSNRPFTYNPHYYAWGGDFMKSLNFKDTFSGSNVGNMLKGGIGAAGSAVGKLAGGAISGGLRSGAGSAISNIGGAIGGAVSAVNPLLGGIISAGTGIIGGLTNRMFGSKLNEEKIAEVEGSNKAINTVMVDSSSADSVMNQWANQDFGADFSKSDIGEDGWFSNKAKNKYKELKKQQDIARNRALTSYESAAEAADIQSDLNAMANFTAFGGPLDIWRGYGSGAIGYELAKENLGIKAMKASNDSRLTSLPNSFSSPELNAFAGGGKIHIKPENRGKFTKYCGGKVTSECIARGKRSSNPAVRKRATFAANARKWKHEDGGPLDTRMELLRRLEERRNRRGNYGGGKHGGGGAGSLFLESPDDFTLVKDTIWVPYRETFNDAFSRARAAGLDEFMFNDKLYNTELGDNPDNYRAGEERVIEGLLPIERTKQVKNKKAEGGELFTNGVTIIGNGGTHEQNPYEGVQMGVDPQGIPNLVEEGEVVFNDYVFSNRLIVPDAVREKYKLRGNKELTFADAAKQMQKESEERPNDPISKRGLLSSMSRLQQAQEVVRQQNQEGQEGVQYGFGGKVLNGIVGLFNSDAAFDNAIMSAERDKIMGNPTASHEDYMFAHGGRMGTLFDGTGDMPNFLDGVDYGDWQGYGALLEPINAENESMAGADGSDEGDTDNSSKLTWLRYAPVVGAAIGLGQNLFSKPDYTSADAILEAANQAGNYTPVGYTPIGNYLQYRPFDRNFYLNKLNAQVGATRRAIMNTTSPSRNAALLAADYNALGRLGDLARQAEEYNLAQRQAVETFNRGTNMANAEMGLKAAMANQEAALKARSSRLSGVAQAMAVRDAVDARRGASMSANLTNFFNSLGDIGREEYSRNMIMSNPALYYSIDSKGNVTYKNGYENLSEAEKKEVRDAANKAKKKKAKGGYLTIKKK